MLRQRHLTLLRAALQYIGEELLPHGPGAMQSYLDEKVDHEFTSSELQELQQFLSRVEVRYTGLDAVDPERVQPQLSHSVEDLATPMDRVAVVLIPTEH
ncbi:MAG: hypothetical protein KDA90_22600 [Planctomycetaceae bacterium]|nr:hypothetical protein [Planctomycetaceae bacterium]